ncbi:MAG: pyrroloquinoline quinone biosynthesis protein PqqE [Frankiaceae bacterium]
MGRPYALLAELTHRCPLHCSYCSNPTQGVTASQELTREAWMGVFEEAQRLGVVQLHLSGGEPLLRQDLVDLVRHARALGFYVDLVTSGLGLSAARCSELAAAGLDHVQLSVQDSDVEAADLVAGARVTRHKLAAARAIIEHGLPLTVNVVLHRHNIERIPALVDLAVELGADRLELANAQYYGWALRNRAALIPDRRQVAAADAMVQTARALHGDAIEIVYVIADYHEAYPKPCMHGWGERHIVVAPDGTVLPCLAAAEIPGLHPERVGERSLADIWANSNVFTRFRGTDWMREPCRSCPRRDFDFGGCRCQAYLLTGDATRTDPVCPLSPDHHLIHTALTARSARAHPRVNPRTAIVSQ